MSASFPKVLPEAADLSAAFRLHLELGRGSNLPTVWANALSAMVLSGGSMTSGATACALAAFSCLYTGGMYFNDACDAAIDARERPERPIPSGRTTAARVRSWAGGWFALGIALAAAARLQSPDLHGTGSIGWLLGCTALVACIVRYDLHHKGNPRGPVWMGACRALVHLSAAMLVLPVPNAPVALAAALGFAWVVGLTRFAKAEAARAACPDAPLVAWPFAALGAPVAIGALGAVQAPLAVVPAVALTFVMAIARTRMRRAGPGDFPAAIGMLIAAVALVDATVLALHGHAGAAVVAATCFGLTLAGQRFVAGT